MATIDSNKFAQDAINAIAEKIRNLKTLNIIVAGKTGVGKSTLINAIFREKLCKTGVGRPVTDHIRRITKKGIPLAIYDTRGLELGREVQDQVKREVIETISKGMQTKDINKTIHCIWYCINAASNRVEPEEIRWIRELSKDNQITQVPIVVVLTQSISKKSVDAIRRLLNEENLDVVQIVPVLAEDYEIDINDEKHTVKSYGLETLIQIMGETLPEELLDTLQNVQIASLSEKKRRAQAAVAAATTIAAGEGAAPIPFSDCALLIPTQLSMIVSITVIFGFDVSKSTLTAFVTSTIGPSGATLLGRLVVSSLLKWIPGAGQIIGGAISGSTAGIITAALGEAYIGIMSLVFSGEMSIDELNSEKGKDKMRQLFREELSKPKG